MHADNCEYRKFRNVALFLLFQYAIILLVIFIIQVAIGVYAFIKINQDPQEFRMSIRNSLQKTFEGYYENNEKRETVDAIQSWVSQDVVVVYLLCTNLSLLK